jgi:coenzyme F420-reducing hydrogenase delta subunit/ferredoxin
MNNPSQIGVFICKCGQKIEPLVDLPALKEKISGDSAVASCGILPYACLKPGMDLIIQDIREKKLDRLIVAGCESRLMLKKFESVLESEGLRKGQIDVVNIRGHVANLTALSPAQKAEKGARLVTASVAGMAALQSGIRKNVFIENPPVIVGGGIASFTAAEEIAKAGLDCLLSLPETDPDVILGHLKDTYPGERDHYSRLKATITGVLNSPRVSILKTGELTGLSGLTGDYTLAFAIPGETVPYRCKAGTIIACLDGELSPPGPEFSHDGKTVLCQPEFEHSLWNESIPGGETVFWINDYEYGHPETAPLSARAAWAMGKHIREKSKKARVSILYHQQMALPLTAAERRLGTKLGITWVPYNKSVTPVLQAGYINYSGLNDLLGHELACDRIILSPLRKMGEAALKTAKILGMSRGATGLIGIHRARVRPEMVGLEETYLAGSAKHPCDLNEALNQGRKAGKKNADMMNSSKAGELYAPPVVCVVDATKCVGCGQCQELCDRGGISVAGGIGGGVPRVVDPMVCTGGGTCAAACPYGALTVQNNTTEQREARVAALSRKMAGDEFVAFACSWAGLPAADNAGNLGLQYDPRVHILGVPCLGQLDPSVMMRAFLEGTPGLLLIGCAPEDCHHSFGIDHTWSRVNMMRKLFTLSGFDRRRIALAHADLNKPEAFVNTVDSFAKTLATLGPIEKSSENQNKLQSLYQLAKYNSRIRLLLSAGLRRPWENNYIGDQRYALQYDQEDFLAALKEEFLKSRLENVLLTENRPLNLFELMKAVSEDKHCVAEQLREMVYDGAIDIKHEEGRPLYLSAH